MATSAGSLIATNLTYAMWIKPSGAVQNWAGLLMDRGGATDGTGMSELGYTWNQNTTWSYHSYLFPPANQWLFVAMVIQPTQTTLYLMNSNGVQSATNVLAHDSETFGSAGHIGNDAQDGGNGGRTFPGSIADVSVYLSALSSRQVTALYNAGVGVVPPPVTLHLAPAGTGSVTLTWSQGTLLQSTNLSGPWATNTATSPYTVGTTNSSTFYRVRVQ